MLSRKTLLVFTLLLALVSTSFAKMEKYDRKSISIFKTDVKVSAKPFMTNKYAKQIHKGIFQKFKNLGRFDYNPIPAGVSNPEELFRIVKEYTATKIEERAGKQWDIKNEYYGTNFVSGENVDKIMNGAYILFPSIDVFTLTSFKDKDKKTQYTCVLTISVKIYSGENTGSVENPDWKPKLIKTISASGTNRGLGLGSLMNFANLKKKNPKKEAVDDALSAMLLFLEKDLKNVEAFKIKAMVTEAKPKKDIIKFNFGKNVGVNLDDAYQIGYYQKTKAGKQKFVETGYMKVRDIKKEESRGQLLIVTNKYGDKEEDLFNEYDQVIEYPLVGLNFQLGGGIASFKSFDDIDNDTSEPQETSTSISFGLEAQYNIAKFVKISELYLNVSADFLLTSAEAKIDYLDETFEIELTTFVYEIGFKKKFFIRRVIPYFGVNFGYEMLHADDKDNMSGGFVEDLTSIGVTPNLGLNILVSKGLYLDINAGWRIYSELIDEDGENFMQGNYTKDEGFWTPTGWFAKASIGFTL